MNISNGFRVKEKTRKIPASAPKIQISPEYQRIVDDHKEAMERIARRGIVK